MIPLGAITEEHYQRTCDTNVKGVLYTIQKALPLLKDGASLILMSSTTSISGTPAFSVYSATKAAVRNFARNWILDLKDRYIRVNAVSPGVTDTAGLNELLGGGTQAEGTKSYLAGLIPAGRVGQPEEIAKAVLFLASMMPVLLTGSSCSWMADRPRFEVAPIKRSGEKRRSSFTWETNLEELAKRLRCTDCDHDDCDLTPNVRPRSRGQNWRAGVKAWTASTSCSRGHFQ